MNLETCFYVQNNPCRFPCDLCVMARSHCRYLEWIDNRLVKPVNRNQWDWFPLCSRSDGNNSGVNGSLPETVAES